MNNMTKKINQTADTSVLPENCWLSYDGKMIFNNSMYRLPYIYAANDEGIVVMKKLHLNYEISYLLTGGDYIPCLFYWNPDFEEYQKITAPLYVRSEDGIYRYTRKNHTGYIPTERMCDEAKGIHRLILTKKNENSVEKYSVNSSPYIQETVNLLLKKYQAYVVAKWVLNGRVSGVAFNDSKSIPDILDWDGDIIKTICFNVNSGGKWRNTVAYFDLTKIKKNEYHFIIVDLPQELKQYGGVIAGKDHLFSSNIVDTLNELGLEIINIYIK